MKRKIYLLTATLLASVLTTNVWAQNWVDVTSTYLDNADFSDPSTITEKNVNTYASDNTKNDGINGQQAVASWTGNDTSDAHAAGAFAIGSEYTVAGSYNVPATNPNGNAEGYVLGLAGCWGSALSYTQDLKVKMPIGKYKFEIKGYNANASATAFGTQTIGVKAGGATYYVSATWTSNTWVTASTEFSLAAETDGQVIIGASNIANGSASSAKVFFTDLKIYYDNSVDKSALEDLITTAEGLYDASKEGAADFNTAINNAKTVKEDASATIAQVLAAETTLQAAIDAFKWANASTENPMDVTATYIANANCSEGTTGWSISTCAANSGQHWSDNSGNKYLEPCNWGANSWTGYAKQTITVPNGIYIVKAAGRASEGVTLNLIGNSANATYPTNGDVGGTIATDGTEWENIAAGTSAGKSFANGNAGRGWTYAQVQVTVTDGTLTLGAESSSSTLHSWCSIDDFTLLYVGQPSDEAAKEAIKAEIATLLTTVPEGQMYSVTQSTLDTKVANANADLTSKSLDDLTTIKSELSDAITAANASIADYANLNAAIQSATNYTVVDATYTDLNAAITTANGIYADGSEESCSDAITTLETALKAAKVADYTYVKDNYQYGVDLGDWTTTGYVANFNNEHWSGTTHDYKNQDDSNGRGWNSSTGFTIGLNQDVKLPAGKYVFKACGRKSAGATMELCVKVKDGDDIGKVSDFPNGNASRGINKDGATSYDEDNDAYANNGNGFGWEWRFVEFELTTETTINVSVSASATVAHEWASFGDYSVLTNDDANIAMIAYNIALNDANLAINNETYKNVTGTEKSELQTAIAADMTDKTKAEIEAATTVLTEATTAFTGAVSAYNAYVEYLPKVDDLDADGQAKFAELEADLEGKTGETISKDLIESVPASYIAAVKAQTTPGTSLTEVIKNAAVVNGESWNNSRTNANEQYTDAPDNTYFDVYNEERNITQNIGTLNPGFYTLKCATRGSTDMANRNANIYVSQNGANLASTDIHADGNTGGALDNGWGWTEVVFNVTDAANDITVGFYADCKNTNWAGADVFTLTYLGDASADMTITDAKYATFVAPFEVTIPDGVKAYGCSTVEGNTLTLVEVETAVPANTPVIVNSESEFNQTFYGKKTEGTPTYGLLTGVYEDTDAPVGSYVLQYQNDKALFYVVESGSQPTVKANRAYLTVSSGAKEFFLEDATGIDKVEVNDQQSTVNGIFNLAGQAVGADYKGIVIINGKKVLKK